MKKAYDYLVVGAGLFGSVFAYEACKKGKKVLVIDKRNHIGGNCYTARIDNIDVHVYGAHVFHTSDEEVWRYVNHFTEFISFVHTPLAIYKDKIFNLPFNMHTFNQMWGVIKPEEAKAIINKQRSVLNREAKHLEEQVLSLVGTDIYETLIKGYTEKQWGKKTTELPASIIERLPLRLTYNNNYFNNDYQGIPKNGYTDMFEKLLANIEVKLGVDYFDQKAVYDNLAEQVVYTGTIDQFYQYRFGHLAYRSLRFEHKHLKYENFQGAAVVNYTEKDVPYTRIIEHKHFNRYLTSNKTIITLEYPLESDVENDPFYPIVDARNQLLYQKYRKLADLETKYLFGGRLAEYKYYDMDRVIRSALDKAKEWLKYEC